MAYTSITERINRLQANSIVLVHPSIEKLEKARRQILTLPSVSEFNIGRELSATLLETPRNQRGRAVQLWLGDRISGLDAETLLCTHIDLLFEPSIGIDPLMLFEQFTREIRLIILWPGNYSDGTLSYAVPEHNHFRVWRIPNTTLSVYRIEY